MHTCTCSLRQVQSIRFIVFCFLFLGYVWWTSFQIITSHFSHPFIFNPSIPPLVSFLLIGSFILLPCLLFIATRIQLLVTCPSVLFVSRLFTVLPIIVQNQAVGQLLKLFIICVGGSATVLAVIGNWWSMSTIDRYTNCYCLLLLLLLFVVIVVNCYLLLLNSQTQKNLLSFSWIDPVNFYETVVGIY